MQLYFIRHGQSTNNVRDGDLTPRSSDPELTEKGVRQAELLAEFLAASAPGNWDPGDDPLNRRGFDLTHLYCSLMKRAIHTGNIIAQRLNLPLFGMPEAHEVGGVFLETLVNDVVTVNEEYGVDEGFLATNYPNLILTQPIPRSGWWRGGKENDNLPQKRAQKVLDWLRQRHASTDDRVAIVTHGGFYNHLLRAMLHISPEEPDNRKLGYRLVYNNCAISRFDFTDERVYLVYHNRAEYLPDDLIT
ncbi:MAG: histidine phosphatase family protein [Anaerolineaceae bacterium]|jgi:2,3-bisphosphoglycerate-dependent phosphoglycerate mutase|nr:histidine phosphatase family protein [Chloroflexota bacterium]